VNKKPEKACAFRHKESNETNRRNIKPASGPGVGGGRTRLASERVQLEIEAHPALAGLPVSGVQLDNEWDVVRLG
jgi:hypothetical protein